ncbi:MAG: hypothetical protein JXO22_13530 [Phycisphaerae bacterium]|nr:hypothetical protein [Phycisphaerae bacterium]
MLWVNFMLHRLRRRADENRFEDVIRPLWRKEIKLSGKRFAEIARVLNRSDRPFHAALAGTGVMWVLCGVGPGLIATYMSQVRADASATAYVSCTLAYLITLVLTVILYWVYRRHVFVIAFVRCAEAGGVSREDVRALRARLRHWFIERGTLKPAEIESDLQFLTKHALAIEKMQTKCDSLRTEVQRAEAQAQGQKKKMSRLRHQREVLSETLGFVQTIAQRCMHDDERLPANTAQATIKQIRSIITSLVDGLKCIEATGATYYAFSPEQGDGTGYPVVCQRNCQNKTHLLSQPLDLTGGQFGRFDRAQHALCMAKLSGPDGSDSQSLLIPVPYYLDCEDSPQPARWYGLVRVDCGDFTGDVDRLLCDPVITPYVAALSAVIDMVLARTENGAYAVYETAKTRLEQRSDEVAAG